MSKSKKTQTTRMQWEDYEDMSGKGLRKEKRKAKRHKQKSDLRQWKSGSNSPEDWDDYMDTFEESEMG